MRPLSLSQPGETLSVLCLGAHSDDIEIGAGGAVLELIASGARLDVLWCVASALGDRADEAKASASAFLDGVEGRRIELGTFEDGYFPYQGAALKAWFAGLRDGFRPDLIFTHRAEDAHQDHREINQITWNLFRDHLILEYEIPKWDGDLARPNLYQPLRRRTLDRKITLLDAHFGSQRTKDWFDEETFRGLARLRGVECRAPEGCAEGFFMKKAVLT